MTYPSKIGVLTGEGGEGRAGNKRGPKEVESKWQRGKMAVEKGEQNAGNGNMIDS